MDIRQLETFIEVIECRNFSKAAENLYLTQPTVSAHINSLEKELNTQLIKRTTKDFEVTEAGEKLYTYGLNIIAIKSKIIEDLVGERNKILKLGSSSAISLGELPDLLKGFYDLSPDIRFEIINSDSLDIIKSVNDGTLEIGLVGTKALEYDLDYTPFLTDELILVTPKNSYYNELFGDGVTIEKILKEPFIVREQESGTKKEINKFFAKHKISTKDVNVIASMNDSISILECIKKGLGISILSKEMIKIYKEDDGILFFPFDKDDTSRDFYIVTTKEKYLSQLVIKFLDYLKTVYSID